MIRKLVLFSNNKKEIQSKILTRYINGLTKETKNNIDILKKIFKNYDKPLNYEQLLKKHSSVNKLTKASVLIPISVKENESSNIYQTFYTLTQRTPKLKFYGGQICFMGGKMDIMDKNVVETAYREAKEEVNIDSERLTLLAQMHPLITTNVGNDSFLLYPIVVYFDNEQFSPVLNKHEVDKIYELPTDRFLKCLNHEISHVELKNDEYYLHYFNDIIDQEEITVWGITALISIIVSTVLHKQSPSFSIDPLINIDPNNVHQFFDDFVLHKSLRLLETLQTLK